MEQDITTLPHARLIQEAFLNTFDSIIVTEPDLEPPGPRIVYVNRCFTEMTGYQPEEVVGRSPRFLQGPRSDRAVIKYLGRRLRAGQSFFGEIINYRKDGTPFYLQWRIVPVHDEQGRIINWVAVQHDISRFRRAQQELARLNQELEQRVQARTRDLTLSNERLRREIEEHRRTEARLRDSEQRFRLLVQGVTDYAIFMLDPTGRITSWNAGAQRFTGYDAEEIIGEPVSRFHLPEEAAGGAHLRILEVARQTGHFEEQGWQVRKDGERYWAHVVVDPIYNEAGHLMGYAMITRDITQQRLSEQALARTMEELMQSNAGLEQFAYAASHDLKAPLRNIFSFIQLMEEECRGRRSEELDQYLTFIRDNANRMYALIEDVLEYSRLRADQGSPQPVDLNAVLARACANLEESIHHTGARILHDELPVIPGFEALLVQLLQNLLSNALKFQPPGQRPRVEIRAERRDGHCCLTVSDNGIGIETPHQNKIFDIFQRLHRTAEFPGTGIGLAICKKAVERHGGTIQVHSAPGEGATFIIRLPHTAQRD